ncbi:MAG: DNA methylase [Deltaproteobacteria bacterium HGW-Deltaproteobacteria-21]|nr:MAG: DNA methylase [Deltaproteobacteria bacterium HGW-Deltaproteobacteria-21]
MIERDFDIPFVADLALREKQIQQNYRPIIAVHKWFARRPGTLFRSLLLSEFSPKPLREAFYQSNSLQGIRIADPFMGGGSPLLEANRVGCDVIGYDINPMSFWIVKQEMDPLDLTKYSKAAQGLRIALEKEIGDLYRTQCILCGNQEAHVKYFLWVKTKTCIGCGKEISLFPGYLLAQNRRHPRNVFVCPACGELSEAEDRFRPGNCLKCDTSLSTPGPAKQNRCNCPGCGKLNTCADPHQGPPEHRLFAIEYHCPKCKSSHEGRFFKKPGSRDLQLAQAAESRFGRLKPKFIPDGPIPEGDESSRLHRWGYKHYREMFNARQLLGLETSCRLIEREPDSHIRDALATNLSDLLRYQNMLCRYDKMALKSLDIFSVHGFPVGLIQCESNFLGIASGSGISIGSGGWLNIIDKFTKAKTYCHKPFEILHKGQKKVFVEISEEWIGDTRPKGRQGARRRIDLSCSDATTKTLAQASLDGVFTDPPYFGNVQYAELMDFCYVWLRKLVGEHVKSFGPTSTRTQNELTGNEQMGRNLLTFTEGLSSVFRQMARALKPGSPMVFTYHHNALSAYYPVAVAILDAGLTCSASLPCPGEMGASIHINGTGSSIIDTVFVCRTTGRVPRRWVPEDVEALAALVEEDLDKLRLANVAPTVGDVRCIYFGHMVRLAIWSLRKDWKRNLVTQTKLNLIQSWINGFKGLSQIERFIESRSSAMPQIRTSAVREKKPKAYDKEISF